MAYVLARTTRLQLRDGQAITLRPVVPDDRSLFVAAFDSLSPESRYQRFFSPLTELTPDVLAYLTEVDYRHHFAWVALTGPPRAHWLAGVARYVRRQESSTAEAAVTVLDPYQGRGLGSLLLDALVGQALEHGITRFEGDVLAENDAVRAILDRAGAHLSPDEAAVLHFELDLPGQLCTEHKGS
ncbi:MAG TPA: GNAT family N-acetyltransferase [Sporichthyaceae bacterium]|nr:GNAT family N-acetyltransferase [Sporichthyaceae bacterium]